MCAATGRNVLTWIKPRRRRATSPCSRRGRGAVQPQQEAPPSERQVKARTFLQIYRAEGIPKVVEHYLKQGRLDEAEKFDKWARSEDTKEGQMAWAQGRARVKSPKSSDCTAWSDCC